jgi:hypothetical protein
MTLVVVVPSSSPDCTYVQYGGMFSDVKLAESKVVTSILWSRSICKNLTADPRSGLPDGFVFQTKYP